MDIIENGKHYRRKTFFSVSKPHSFGWFTAIIGSYLMTSGPKYFYFWPILIFLTFLNILILAMCFYFNEKLKEEVQRKLENIYYVLQVTNCIFYGIFCALQNTYYGPLSVPQLGVWLLLVAGGEVYASYLYPRPKFFLICFMAISYPLVVSFFLTGTPLAFALGFLIIGYTPVIYYRVLKLTDLLKQSLINLQEVNDQKKQLQTFLDSLPSMISWVGSDLKYKAINKKLKEAIGGDDVIGMPIGFKDGNSPLVNEVSSFFESELDNKNVEFLLNTNEGQKWYQSYFSKHDFGHGKELFIISHDIDKEKSLQKDLEVQKNLADQSLRLANLGRMASGVAHEINNPLAIAEATLTLIKTKKKRGTLTEEEVSSKYEKISNALQRIAKVIDGMTTFSQKEAPREYEIINISELIDEIRGNLNEKMNSLNIEFKSNISSDDLTYHASKNEIGIILSNFIDNAIDAIKETEPVIREIEVTAKIDNSKDQLLISVSDTANNLKEDIESLLVPFYSTKTDNKIMGMGLSLSRYIANIYDGDIHVNTENNKTTFTLHLPIDNSPLD